MKFERCLFGLALVAWLAPGVVLAEPRLAAVTPEAIEPAQAPAVVANPVASADVAAEPVVVKRTAAPKPVVSLQAKVDLTRQTMTVIERGKTVGVWKISSGVADHATPRGSFQPEWTSKMWFSHTYDGAPMPHAVFFKDGVAVHATQATGALGRAASHGCVRLAPANAEAFYKLVQRHGLPQTRIAVFGVPTYQQPVQHLAAVRRDTQSIQRVRVVGLQPRNAGSGWGVMWGATNPVRTYALANPMMVRAR